jgi:formiminoglutamase
MTLDPTMLANTSRPEPAVFHRRGDPNDLRLGEVVSADPADYAAADVVLLGYPEDEGVRRNGGRPGAARAPHEIRRFLYRLPSPRATPRIFDLGDTIPRSSLEETHAAHQDTVARVIADGKRLVVLGGGNDVSYPDCAGLAAAAGPPLAITVDAHFDVRADTPRNSGTPYRQLLDEGLLAPARLYELGSQPFANSPTYAAHLRERGVAVIPLTELRMAGVAATVEAILTRHDEPPLFWGFDMDAVRAADAPGVSAPNPLGMAGEELCRLAAIAGAEPRTRLIELSEVNPVYDVDGRTCRLAAVAIWYALFPQ